MGTGGSAASSPTGPSSAVPGGSGSSIGGGAGGQSTAPENVIRVQHLLLKLPAAIEFSGTNPASFYALNERIVAAESCWFAAKVTFICSYYMGNLRCLTFPLLCIY
jgi:hypothetical protein